jgi:hypothetical protein
MSALAQSRRPSLLQHHSPQVEVLRTLTAFASHNLLVLIASDKVIILASNAWLVSHLRPVLAGRVAQLQQARQLSGGTRDAARASA